MPVFTLHCLMAQAPAVRRRFAYDSDTSTLVDMASERPVVEARPREWTAALAVSSAMPGLKRDIQRVKIQLGLSCNFACNYCSQRFVPHSEATAQRDLEPFLAQLPAWFTGDGQGKQIEFWGGEPFAYWRTLKPLAEELRVRYPAAILSVITNGSLIDAEKVEWLERLQFQVGISHDGPGQAVRGPDPLEEPETRAAILDLYRRLAPTGRISFNAMMNRRNTSRAAVQAFFVELTGDPAVRIGEGGFVDAYDEGGLAESLPAGEAVAWRKQAMAELQARKVTNFYSVNQKFQRFAEHLKMGRPAASLGQKCGMDRPNQLAVDLKGNVLTCQNTSAVAKAGNGQSHKIGHVSDLAGVRLRTADHWSRRAECPGCPVLHLCGGGCMYLQDALWKASCDNAYSDNVVLFAAAIEWITGFMPYRIEHEDLPADRQWLWRAPPAA